jgi:DNA-binding transcriptional ArsR family regulator
VINLATKTKQVPALNIDISATKKAALVVRALNNPLRQKILKLIHENGSMTVRVLYHKIKQEQSVTSMHLAILRHAGFVNSRREGHYMHYSINYGRIKEALKFSRALIKFE